MLTKWEVQSLVFEWFRELTMKSHVDTLLSMLSSDALEMKFPEETLTNYDDFKKWYHTVTHQFFNQVHDIKLIEIEFSQDQAEVNLIVHWENDTWQPPAAVSKHEAFDIYQTWVVKRDTNSGKPVIATYEVGAFKPATG
ncbi:MAG: hypothetical protein HC837_07165 [Chloroflexaceae bacterium]|nr:hypothetical protein [Chloroflexaceae bacterium]